jgi:hypothetical protein
MYLPIADIFYFPLLTPSGPLIYLADFFTQLVQIVEHGSPLDPIHILINTTFVTNMKR